MGTVDTSTGLDFLHPFRDTGSRLVIEFSYLFYTPDCFFDKTRRKSFWGERKGVTYPAHSCFLREAQTVSHPNGSQWTAATHAGGWLSVLSLTGRVPATHTAASPAQHPQPGAAAAALSCPGSRRGASVWSPLRSAWETAAGRTGG